MASLAQQIIQSPDFKERSRIWFSIVGHFSALDLTMFQTEIHLGISGHNPITVQTATDTEDHQTIILNVMPRENWAEQEELVCANQGS